MEHQNDSNARLHYDLRLWVNPLALQMTLSGSLVYHAPPQGAAQARFYLDPRFSVRALEGRRVTGYQFETHPTQPMPASLDGSGVLDIHFDPPLAGSQATLVRFELEARLTASAQAARDWVELALPLAWYPAPEDTAASDLTFTVQVTCPAGYAAASMGGANQQGEAWHFAWPHPTDDIVVMVGRRLKARTYESESNKVHLHSAGLSERTAALLGEDLLWAIERYAGWFGPVRPSEFTVIHSPRVQGPGYARRGLVVLPDISEQAYLDQREGYLRYLAHEAAHTWWWAAPNGSWEAWLNESFAEYSALMAIRERYGAQAYQQRLEHKRRQVTERLAEPCALWGFDRADTTTAEKQAQVEAQLYDRGPLLLHDLAERIGYRRFVDLCRAMQWSEVRSTAHFLDLLEELEDRATRLWMEEALKHA